MGVKVNSILRIKKRIISFILGIILTVTTFSMVPCSTVWAMPGEQGIDVSFWQGNVNWPAVKASGVTFAFIRLGNLKTGLDSKFYQNMAGAQAVGIKTGVYIYSSAMTIEQVAQEAVFVMKALENVSVSFPVVYDIEDDTQLVLPKETVTLFCNTFCAILEQAGYYPMVYANKYWFTKRLGYIAYDKWVAQWGAKCEVPDAAIWQYTSKAAVPGIAGNMDRDVMIKDYEPMFIHTGFVNRNGYIYFLQNYRVYKGLLDLGTTKYFLDEFGHLYTGLLPVGNDMMYFKEDGQMATGFTFINGKVYLFGFDGLMKFGMQDVGQERFFFNNDGTLYTGFLSDGISTFYFDPLLNGQMVKGLATIDGSVYYFDNNGVMQTGLVDFGGTYFFFDETGKLIPDALINNNELLTTSN